jgi:hypothetical protein
MNKFYIGGRVMLGPNYKRAYFTFCLMTFSSLMTVCTLGVYILEEEGSNVVIGIECCLWLLTVIWFVATAITEPGYMFK